MDKRVWMYRHSEARIFPSPESVPEGEGWVDSPAKVVVPVISGGGGGNSDDLTVDAVGAGPKAKVVAPEAAVVPVPEPAAVEPLPASVEPAAPVRNRRPPRRKASA